MRASVTIWVLILCCLPALAGQVQMQELSSTSPAASDPCPPGSEETLWRVQGLLRSDYRVDRRADLGVTGVDYRELRLLRLLRLLHSPEDNAACEMIRSTPFLVIEGKGYFFTGDLVPDPPIVFGFYEAGGFYFVASGPPPGIIRMGHGGIVSVFSADGRFLGRG